MRCPFAIWRGPIPNQRTNGVARPARGFVFHVIVGTLGAADSVFHNPNYQASAHFGIGKDGTVYQWVDTDDRAWAEGSGNPEWLSCETEGQPSEPLTNAQVAQFARLFNWGQVHGPYPYLVTDSPTGRGLGTHSMGGAAWGGHECPGAIRASQRSLILQTAAGGAPTPPQEEDDMRFVQPQGDPRVFEVGAQLLQWVPNEGVLNYDSRGKGFAAVEVKPLNDYIWARPEAYPAADGTVKYKQVSGTRPGAPN